MQQVAAPRADARVRDSPGTRTAGMVRQLLKRMPPLVDRRPAEALLVTSLAVAIADVLNPQDYPPDHVLLAHGGQALRDHAFVLALLGREADALEMTTRAGRVFVQVPDAGEGWGRVRERTGARDGRRDHVVRPDGE